MMSGRAATHGNDAAGVLFVAAAGGADCLPHTHLSGVLLAVVAVDARAARAVLLGGEAVAVQLEALGAPARAALAPVAVDLALGGGAKQRHGAHGGARRVTGRRRRRIHAGHGGHGGGGATRRPAVLGVRHPRGRRGSCRRRLRRWHCRGVRHALLHRLHARTHRQPASTTLSSSVTHTRRHHLSRCGVASQLTAATDEPIVGRVCVQRRRGGEVVVVSRPSASERSARGVLYICIPWRVWSALSCGRCARP